MGEAERLLDLAQRIVDTLPDFFELKGPGAGDKATAAFMERLRGAAIAEFGADHAEQEISGSNGFRVDYYFPDEGTIVEVALGLRNPRTEFECDILKALMAKEVGHRVDRLVFISKPPAAKKCMQPGRTAIREWLLRNHGIEVDVHDLRPLEGRRHV
jgi:hypothetical protein